MLSALLASAVINLLPNPDDAYIRDTETWRTRQESELKTPQGWLSLVGLIWLKPGDNTIGSASDNKVVLPNSAAAHFGTIHLEGGVATLLVAGEGATSGVAAGVPLQSDSTRLTSGTATFVIIHRGARTGVRIWDSESKNLKDFKGCKWFPVDPKYRIEADYVPYPTAKTMPITNVLGDTAPVSNPGYVTFTIGGKTCRLEAQGQGGGFFFNFADRTSGKETYPAGRFLDAPAPKDGKVLLDFNRATNPPCAFTSFATCPLPPSANRLSVAIPAGEKVHHPGHEG